MVQIMNYPKLILHSGKEVSLQRKHLWVFSGAIKKIISPQGKNIELKDGDVVEVVSNENKYLATGHFQHGSIAVRILSFERTEINSDFWKSKIQAAYDFRKMLGLTDNSETNVFRLVNAEGDNLPGLIIDFYNGVAVMQTHSIGFHLIRKELAEILKNIFGEKLKAVYDKSSETIPKRENLKVENEYLFNSESGIRSSETKIERQKIVVENGNKFFVDWESGQKTGFFIDQRENRKLLSHYVKDKTVLNVFCYTGGFSVYALNAGAKEVYSLDSSKKAIELTEKNIELNNFAARHKSICADALEYFSPSNGGGRVEADVIVLDPPAFAKHLSARHKAVQGYKRLNALAMKQIKPNGIIFTFSCSQAVDRNLFYNTIVAAAIESGRNIKALHHLSQPPDHPVNIFHPEGEYLKGLVLFVE